MKDRDRKERTVPKGTGREDAGQDGDTGLSEEERRALRAARRDALLDAPLDLRTRVQEDKRRKRRDAPKHKGRALEDGDAGAAGAAGPAGED
ncbi:hypothetical protein [Nitratidesulfovibrio sp. 1201_IL3209]|uniref:hypothetical protein n=1 Tax=Nitratidesulfovibrio sp. 1201_IL3209 TaxID=3084053 RepID=UPI002FDA9842